MNEQEPNDIQGPPAETDEDQESSKIVYDVTPLDGENKDLPRVSESPVDEAAASQITALQSELEEVNARLMRVSADYQNFARRSEQNVSNAREQQVMNIARSLVSVLDHFDLALEVDSEKTTAKNLLDGMQIVRDELLRTLERFGVARLEVQSGDEFDPNRHEALMRLPGEGVESNRVVGQLQPGYLLGDKTLRAAQVSVAE